MNIDISRIGLLDIADSVHKMRRLMSIQVFYTIASTDLSESKAIESGISLPKLNSILSTASNNTLSATHIQIKTNTIFPRTPDVIATTVETVETKDNTTMIIVICVAISVILIIGGLFMCLRKSLAGRKLESGGFNILDNSHEYCPVFSYAIDNS